MLPNRRLVTRVQQPLMESLFLLNTQILPGGSGNTTYRMQAGFGKKKRRGGGKIFLSILRCIPVSPKHLAFTDPFPQYAAANLKPLRHVHKYFLPFPLKIRRLSPYPQP
jgi:hypothetical protein